MIDLPGDASLHPDESEPAAQYQLPVPRRGPDLDLTVDRDRMVDGGHERQPGPGDVEQRRTQPLVVVDDIKLPSAGGQQRRHPSAERPGLGESGGTHRAELEQVGEVAKLRRARCPEWLGLGIQVQARHTGQRHPLVELGGGGAGEDFDPVTEGDELPREVPDVDALPTAVRLAPVAGQSNAQRTGRVEGTHKLTPVFDWNRRWSR